MKYGNSKSRDIMVRNGFSQISKLEFCLLQYVEAEALKVMIKEEIHGIMEVENKENLEEIKISQEKKIIMLLR